MKELIAKELNVSIDFIIDALKYSYIHVKHIKIPKRHGGERRILIPSVKLKTIQYWLMHKVFSKMQIHDAAMAYVKNRSIVKNAFMHSRNKYFLKLDLKEFFPSVKYRDLITRVEKWHEADMPGWTLNTEAKDIFKRVCFDETLALPQGYSSSPVISNIVMHEVDSAISNAIVGHEDFSSEIVYSRYADDMVFSTNIKGECAKIYEIARGIIYQSKSPQISLNGMKTKYVSSTGGSAIVTGLRVCSDGHITLHKKHKSHIRLMLSLLHSKKLPEDEFNSLKGHLNYVMHADPAFYTKIQGKYFKEIGELNDGEGSKINFDLLEL